VSSSGRPLSLLEEALGQHARGYVISPLMIEELDEEFLVKNFLDYIENDRLKRTLRARAKHWEHISLIYLKYMSDILIWPYQALIRLIFHITTDIRYQPDIRPSRRRIRLIPGP
jgi:hypothetical protein